jgi:hypothetical protein
MVSGQRTRRVKSRKHHFYELAVLDHHRVYDSKERLVTREETRAAGESISLQHSLASMFGQYFNDSAPLRSSGYVPLEIAASFLENRVQFIRHQLVRREDSDGSGVATTPVLALVKISKI